MGYGQAPSAGLGCRRSALSASSLCTCAPVRRAQGGAAVQRKRALTNEGANRKSGRSPRISCMISKTCSIGAPVRAAVSSPPRSRFNPRP